jgi:hypothetical protein
MIFLFIHFFIHLEIGYSYETTKKKSNHNLLHVEIVKIKLTQIS